MTIAVIGAGGVGGYFGGKLAAAGYDVRFLARGAHLAALRQEGLTIESGNGNLHVRVRATDDPNEVGPVDYIWIAVKLWDTAAAAEAARAMIGRSTTVISFQNGVEKDAVLQAALPGVYVLGGVSYIASVIGSPGRIVHTGSMARLVFGDFNSGRSAPAEALLAACRNAGIDAEIPADIRVAIWQKFIFLVGLSAVTTATRLPVGAIRRIPRTRELLMGIVREAVEVGRARGVPIGEDLVQARLAQFETLPDDMTSSMHQDLKRGNRLEVEWLSGAVVRLGGEAGVATPLNGAIWAVLEPYAQGSAALGDGGKS